MIPIVKAEFHLRATFKRKLQLKQTIIFVPSFPNELRIIKIILLLLLSWCYRYRIGTCIQYVAYFNTDTALGAKSSACISLQQNTLYQNDVLFVI